MSATNHLPNSGFGKIFETTYTGSLLGSGPIVMSVWPYVIANTKPPGIVELVPRYIAAVIGCDPGQVEEAIKFLQKRDPESRSKEEDGRRLIQLEGHLYKVPTWHIYRSKRDDDARKAYFREAKRKSRLKSKPVKDILGKSTLSTQAEADAGIVSSPSGSHPDKSGKARERREEAELIYQAYPRKIAKKDGVRAIEKALVKIPFADLLEATTAYAQSRIGQDPSVTPYPATWFNAERYHDDRSQWTLPLFNPRTNGKPSNDFVD